MRTELVTDVLTAAERTCGSLAGAVMHTDHGLQYTSSEACKLIEGCVALGAGGLVLATSKLRWSDTTVQVLQHEVQGRRVASRVTPKIVLLTGLGIRPDLTVLEA